jgi:hypothetical protein
LDACSVECAAGDAGRYAAACYGTVVAANSSHVVRIIV